MNTLFFVVVLPPIAMGLLLIWFVRKKTSELHVQLDGRLGELLEVTKQLAHAQGLLKGKEEGRQDSIRQSEMKHEMELRNQDPQDVTIMNPINNPANVKVGNLPTEPVPTTVAEKKEEIKKLSEEIREEQAK